MSFAKWCQIAFQNSFSVEIRQNSLTHRHTLLWPLSFFVVLVRNSYPWWTNECTNSIFFLSPFPKLSPFPSPLTTLNFFLFFSWVWVFIRRQLVFLCCQIISHLFLITFVCTWFLFTHQSVYGISFYLFPESMEWGLYREGKKKKKGEKEVG